MIDKIGAQKAMKRLVFFVLFIVITLGLGVWFIMANSRVEEDRQIDGITEKYYWFGKLLAARKYQNSQLNGLTKTFYEDGAVKGEWMFKDGKMDGVAKQYNRDGSLKYEDLYAAGKKISRKTYDKQGKLISETKEKS